MTEVVTIGPTEVIVVSDTEVIVIEVAEQGQRGQNGINGEGAITVPFAYGDASPAFIAEALAGKTIYSVQIFITTAFNGTGAALTVGDAGDADRLMQSTENDPSGIAGYSVAPSYKYSVDTDINLTITPGAGASAGAGLLVISIQQ